MRNLCVALVAGLMGCMGESAHPTKVLAATAADDTGALVPDAIVVDFKDGTTAAEIAAKDKEWGIPLAFNSLEGPFDGITLARGVSDVDVLLAKIRKDSAVVAAEPLVMYQLPAGEEATPEGWGTPNQAPETSGEFVPNDPDFGKQWNLRMIDMPKAWGTTRGKGAIVAVLDTGIAYEDRGDFKQVPDLKGVKFVKGYDFVNDTDHPNDDNGHGTHVAGTIAQATNNGQGVAGIAFEATLMPVKVLDHFGRGSSADIADAIRFAADNGANVINMSLGGGGYSQVMANAVAYARKKGVTVVCAAGNSGRGTVEYPAAYPGAVAVAAVGPDGMRAPYSSYGKELDIAAPGGDKRQGPEGGILQNTIDPQDPAKSVYAYYQGTSMATPHVAGVAALLYARGAESPDEVEQALFAGAKQVGSAAWTEQYGHGILNAQRSLEALGRGPGGVDWHPLAWGAVLLAGVLLTIGRRFRPGYFNVLFSPRFGIPLLLSTVGAFFLKWISGHFSVGVDSMLETAAIPIPDWQRFLFGRGSLANPAFYSALVPIVGSLIGIGWKGARPVIGGIAIGFGAFLAYAAWAKAPALAYLPFTFLARPWLLVNAVVCLFISRAMLRKESA